MSSFKRIYVFLILLIGFSFTNVLAQGVLIFEISDSQNKPVAGLNVEVTGDEVSYKYTTDSNGRIVDMSMPAGHYTYNFTFGDLHTDTFSIEDAGYNWINLDYRILNVTFLTEDGLPLEGKKVTIYKVQSDNSETYVCERQSDKDGNTQFLLPEGDYRFDTFRGTEYIRLDDENVNTKVEMTSGLVTHQTHFGFKKGDDTIKVYAKDVNVISVVDGVEKPFGSVVASSTSGKYMGFYQYSVTQEYVSCSEGDYKATVSTKDYGNLTCNFSIDDNAPLINHVVFFELPDLPKDTTPHEPKDPGKGDVLHGDKDDDSTEVLPFILDVTIISELDSVTPLPSVLVNLSATYNPSAHSHQFTNSYGRASWMVTEGDFDLVAHYKSMHLYITGDTAVTMYVDPNKMKKVYFDFYYGDEKFDPVSVPYINVWMSDDVDCSTFLEGEYSKDKKAYEYNNPIYPGAGPYSFSFYIREKDYDQRIMGNFYVDEKDTVVRVPINLPRFYSVKVVMFDANGDTIRSRQYLRISSSSLNKNVVTDSLGIYETKMEQGDYRFIALGDTQLVQLSNDTVLYFQLPTKVTQRVKFQFLHDGIPVYPQILSMDVYKDSVLYSKMLSSYYENYEGKGEAWVFHESTVCEEGDYYVEYVLKDYQYNGTYQYKYTIANPVQPDTMMYIVVPVKRTVTITVKDANLDLVKGVFATIYKYDENDSLLSTTYYDDALHSGIKTNSNGNVIDHLVPGRYQIQILDIVRDFIVKDYDLNFEIISGVKLYDVKYVVQYKSTKKPGQNLLLDVEKDNAFYNSSYTNEKGVVELFCEKGNYSYFLHYGKDHRASYKITADTTIYIFIEDPVLIDSMRILNCVCLNHKDTVELDLRIMPSDATMQEVEWSVDNPWLAHVTTDGKLITHDVKTDGFVTVTATSIDGSTQAASRKFFVGDGKCGADYTLSFANIEATEIPLISDTVIGLSIKALAEDGLDRYYLYQMSYDSLKWKTLYGPTNLAEVEAQLSDVNKDIYIRALVSSSIQEVTELAKSGTLRCPTEVITNKLTIRYNSLKPVNWTDSICSTQDALTFVVDRTALGTLTPGYELVWYMRTNKNDEPTRLDEWTGKDTAIIELHETSYIMASIQNEESSILSYEGEVFVETLPVFDIVSSKDTLCVEDEVTLAVVVSQGGIDTYNWVGEDKSDSAIVVPAQNKPYVVEMTSRYHVCPSQSDTINLVIDYPIDIDIYTDKVKMCETDKEGALIRIDSLGTTIGSIVWSDSSQADTLRVVPSETTTYSVTAHSWYDKCPTVEKSMKIIVNDIPSVSLSVDNEEICQYGSDSVTLTATVVTGEVERYIWWDGKETKDPSRTLLFTETEDVYVSISDGICADSEKDSIKVQVARPAESKIATTTTVFEYGGEIDLNTSTTDAVWGPYTWHSVDVNGEDQILSVTDEPRYTDMPNGDVIYYVTVENGPCPVITSDIIAVALVDNITIPTVFTPHIVDGQNDDFMPGYPTIIYDRYGNIISNSDNGWDGQYRGAVADPGVYMYVIRLKDNREVKGTIEIFRK